MKDERYYILRKGDKFLNHEPNGGYYWYPYKVNTVSFSEAHYAQAVTLANKMCAGLQEPVTIVSVHTTYADEIHIADFDIQKRREIETEIKRLQAKLEELKK
jgi:hypothetical protein